MIIQNKITMTKKNPQKNQKPKQNEQLVMYTKIRGGIRIRRNPTQLIVFTFFPRGFIDYSYLIVLNSFVLFNALGLIELFIITSVG